jgi:phospholipase C
MSETPDTTPGQETPASRHVSRRRVLGGAAAVAGGAAAALALPPNVRKAMAATSVNGAPPSFSLGDVKHVVILMQENRSFDHYYGTMNGVRGFSDPHALKLPNGKSVFYQPDPLNPDGYLLPYHLDTMTTAAAAIPSTSHAWQVQHEAWNGGAMDQWMRAHIAADGTTNSQFIMGYYERADIPFHWALADNFTICDNYHCAVLGPTHPNRFMLLTGTIDPNGEHGGPALDNGGSGYTWETYAEMLEAAGVSWRMYNDVNEGYPYNMLMDFANFANAQPGSALYEKAVTVNYGEFEYDAINDNLPTVSWIATTGAASEHPNAVPALGAQYVYSKIDAIAANPDVWAKTVFILNYDENDGLFDHVPPPVAPPGTPDEYVTLNSPYTVGGDLPVGPGFRVPCTIVSPWTVGGYVYSAPSDHTSVLRFLEKVTGVPCPNISAYRRQALSDLTGAFQQEAHPEPPRLYDSTGAVSLTTYVVDNFPLPTPPGASQTPPKQEPGPRPHIG